MDCSLPGSSVHGIFEARVLEWGAISFSKKNTQKNCTKKDLHNQDNQNGVITHLELDILECEVKWALGSTTMNKASGGGRIPAELFKLLKDGAVKCCTQYVSKFGKLSSGHRTGKRELSEASFSRVNPINEGSTPMSC